MSSLHPGSMLVTCTRDRRFEYSYLQKYPTNSVDSEFVQEKLDYPASDDFPCPDSVLTN